MKKIPPFIEIRDARLTYSGELVFEHLNLTLKTNNITCLLGPSGVGKTTLLRMMAGLTSTRIKINCDTDQITYLPQQDTLLPWLNTLNNALIGSRLRGTALKTIKNKARALFSAMGLSYAENKFPYELSGGMRQRVALIRTLLEDKPILLMDEPFAALDAITRFQLQNLACELLKNRTVLLVTHDPLEALRIANEIYILSGKPAQLHLFTKLMTPTPRDLTHTDIVTYQAPLFEALTKAKEATG